MSKPWTLEIKVTKSLTKSDMTIYLSPSIVDCHCIARLKLINHFQRTKLQGRSQKKLMTEAMSMEDL